MNDPIGLSQITGVIYARRDSEHVARLLAIVQRSIAGASAPADLREASLSAAR